MVCDSAGERAGDREEDVKRNHTTALLQVVQVLLNKTRRKGRAQCSDTVYLVLVRVLAENPSDNQHQNVVTANIERWLSVLGPLLLGKA